MYIKNKRGLSPVIATVLLILIGFVLAAIIFIWAKSFIAEKIEKDLGGGREAIENICPKVEFDADAEISVNDLNVHIGNKGNIPIYGIEVRKKSLGGLKIIGTKTSNLGVKSGEDEVLAINISTNKVVPNDEIIIVPILLGEAETTNITKAYTCDEKYGVEIVAG